MVSLSAAFSALIIPYKLFFFPPSIGSYANGRNSVQRQLNCSGWEVIVLGNDVQPTNNNFRPNCKE